MKFSHIIRTLAAIILGAYFVMLVCFDIEAVQVKMGKVLGERLSELFKTEVRIQRVKVGLFDHVILHGVIMKDQKGEDMLTAEHLSAKISLSDLLYGEVMLRSLALLDSDVNLYKDDAGGDPNFQFVIDALSSDENKTSSLHLGINSIILRRCHVNYDQRDVPRRVGVFSTTHLDISDIDANISLKLLTRDSLSLRVRSLSLKERSGLAIEGLSGIINANKRAADVRGLALRLPHSIIEQDYLHLDYDADPPACRQAGLGSTLAFGGSIRGARLSTRDFLPLVPELKHVDLSLNISTDFKVTPSEIRFSQLRIGDSKDIYVELSELRGVRDADGIKSISAKLASLRLDVPAVAHIAKNIAPIKLPTWIDNLRYIEAKGQGDWLCKTDKQQDKANVGLEIKTAIGHLDVDANYTNGSLSGKISTEGLNIAQLIGLDHLPADVTSQVAYDVNLDRMIGKVGVHIASLYWDNRNYENIGINCSLSDEHTGVSVDARDNNANLTANVESSLRLQQIFDNLKTKDSFGLKADIDIRNLKLPNICLPQEWKGADVSGRMYADVTGLSLSARPNNEFMPDGIVKISAIHIVKSNPDDCKDISLGDITLSMHRNAGCEHLRLDSDFLTADYDGALSADALLGVWHKLLTTEDKTMSRGKAISYGQSAKTDTRLALRFSPNQAFQDLTGLNISANAPVNILGTIAAKNERAMLTIDAPHIAFGNTELAQLRLMFETHETAVSCLGSVKKRIGDSDIQLEVHGQSEGSRLNIELVWDDGYKHHYFGNVKMQTQFGDENTRASASTAPIANRFTPLHVTLLPTELVVSDTIWNIDKGDINWDGKALKVSGFRISNASDRSIAINGTLGNKATDSLAIALKDIDVDYILNIVDFDDVTFGGLATGNATVKLTDGVPDVDGLLHIPKFKFNDGDMGDALIGIRWDGPEKTIRFDAKMSYPEDPGSLTKVDGWVSPAKEGLDLRIHSIRSKIQFLRPYTDDIFSDLDGKVTGDVRFFGGFKSLDFEGRVKAEASARIKQTGVTYKVTDADVEIVPGTFKFLRADFTDQIGGAGFATGELRHTHLKHFNFNVDMEGRHLLLYDKSRELDLPFYAHVIATGAVGLEGTPDAFTANIRITPDEGSTMTYIMDTPESYGGGSLLTFREAESIPTAVAQPVTDTNLDTIPDDSTAASLTTAITDESKTDIRLNFVVNATPNATVNILMDDRTGDNISVRGSGMIQASWYNKGDMNMYGTYLIDSGSYSLSIQKLIHKKFELLPGGTIVFTGNPLDSDLNFQASYMVNSASLSDLNITSLSTKNIRVNCLLNVTGKPSNVGVTFDIDMPTTSDEEKQMVRSLMASEEDMTTQVLYLLGFGRFYNYNYEATTAGGQSQTSTLMNSFLSNTLSSQFNNMLSNALGTNNWTFGANVATGNVGWSDVAVEGLLSGRLFNNRLLLNGNFGYRDSKTSTQNAFVGDFDLQYLLTPQGSARLKAYSETNDRYFIKNASTTQGIGIVLQREFGSIFDFFRRKKKTNK